MAKQRWQWTDQPVEVEVTPVPDGLTLRYAGRNLRVSPLARHGPALTFSLDGRLHGAWVLRRGDMVFVTTGGETFTFAPGMAAGAAAAAAASPDVVAPMPGKVLAVHASEGATVRPGDGVVVVEAMKMETVVRAEVGGTVRRVHVSAGDTVEAGQLLIEIDPAENAAGAPAS